MSFKTIIKENETSLVILSEGERDNDINRLYPQEHKHYDTNTNITTHTIITTQTQTLQHTHKRIFLHKFTKIPKYFDLLETILREVLHQNKQAKHK